MGQAALLVAAVEGVQMSIRRLIAWLIARSRAGQLALWVSVYAAACVAEFVVKWVKELWRDEDEEEIEPT